MIEAREREPNVDFILINQTLEGIRHLRQMAEEANMLPSLEEEMAGLDKDSLQEEFSELDARIWAGVLIG